MHTRTPARQFQRTLRSKKFSLSKKFSKQSLKETFCAVKSCESLFSSAVRSFALEEEQVKTFVFVFAHSFSFISTFCSSAFVDEVFHLFILGKVVSDGSHTAFNLCLEGRRTKFRWKMLKMLYRRRHPATHTRRVGKRLNKFL